MGGTARKPEKKFFLVVLGLFLLFLQVRPIVAGRIPVDKVRISTPVYAPADSFNPLPGRYFYSVSWNGIPAASVELELGRNGDDFEIRASARTARGLDLVFKLRYESETVLAADTLKTKHSFSVNTTNFKKKTTKIEFLPDGEIISIRKENQGRVKTLKFKPDNFTLDPYSAGFLVLSQEWKVGERRRFDIFSGKSRYLIEFSAVEKTDLTVNGKVRPAIVLAPTIRKLTDDGEDAKENKLQQARIYISADQPREIIKLSSRLLFGSVDTEMVGFTPAPTPALPAADQDKNVVVGAETWPALPDNFLLP